MKTQNEYLIVGDGRLASHLKFYLLHEQLPFQSWSRREEARSGLELPQLLDAQTTVLLAIKDDALEKFYEEHLSQHKESVVHFSGSFSHAQMVGLHPLASFHHQLFSPQFYREILFVSEAGRPGFKDIFPDLPNPTLAIDTDKKAFYHSICSLAANLSQFLWAECYENLHATFGISEGELQPFLISTFENLAQNPKAITGPLTRGDFQTVHDHENALDGHLLHEIYRSFVHTFLRSRHCMEASDENSSRFFEV